ncbi:hypothetical protein D3C73_1416730 [compost metagenome]
MFSVNDIKALKWIKEHHGEVSFRNGYYTFNEDGTYKNDISTKIVEYVVVEVGFEKKMALTIEAATLQLQERYYGMSWNNEKRIELYA